jgi:hypothetical protein
MSRSEGGQGGHEGGHLLKVGHLRLLRPIYNTYSRRMPTTYGSLSEGGQLAKERGSEYRGGAAITQTGQACAQPRPRSKIGRTVLTSEQERNKCTENFPWMTSITFRLELGEYALHNENLIFPLMGRPRRKHSRWPASCQRAAEKLGCLFVHLVGEQLDGS